MTVTPPGRRFLQLAEVAEVLSTSSAQVYALVRSGELPAIKIGGRGQWRVESSELEKYIERMYEQTRDFISRNPPVKDRASSSEDDESGSGPDDAQG